MHESETSSSRSVIQNGRSRHQLEHVLISDAGLLTNTYLVAK